MSNTRDKQPSWFCSVGKNTAEALIASGKVEDPMQGEKGITEPYTTCTGSVTPPVSKVPKVVSSVISNLDPYLISVKFDTDMQASANLEKAIKVTTAEVVSAIRGKELDITLKYGVQHGETLTWAYNDQHPTEYIKLWVLKQITKLMALLTTWLYQLLRLSVLKYLQALVVGMLMLP